MRYSIEPRDRVFVKDYIFLSLAENMGKNIGKNVSQNLSSKYSQKLLGHAKQFITDALKTIFRKSNSKTAETTGDLIRYKIANKITKASRASPQDSEIVESETKNTGFDRDIPEER